MLPTNFSLTHQRRDPFLWFHVAAIAAVPLTLVLSMLGLAVGDPVFPGWLEIFLLGLPPIALSVWLQYSQPIFPYSLWVMHRPADKLADNQLKVLSLQKSYVTGWVAIVVGVFLYVVFRQLYISAPLAAGMTFLPSALRLVGVLWAVVFFAISALLLQVGVAAARILIMPVTEFMAAEPFDPANVGRGFFVIGQRSPKLFESALNLAEPGELETTTVELLEPPYEDQQSEQPQITGDGKSADVVDQVKAKGVSIIDTVKQKIDQLLAEDSQVSKLIAKVVALLPGQAKSAPVEPTATGTTPAPATTAAEPEEDEWLSETEAEQPTEPEISEAPEVESSVETEAQPEAEAEEVVEPVETTEPKDEFEELDELLGESSAASTEVTEPETVTTTEPESIPSTSETEPEPIASEDLVSDQTASAASAEIAEGEDTLAAAETTEPVEVEVEPVTIPPSAVESPPEETESELASSATSQVEESEAVVESSDDLESATTADATGAENATTEVDDLDASESASEPEVEQDASRSSDQSDEANESDDPDASSTSPDDPNPDMVLKRPNPPNDNN
jgi:hypothetical protein